MTEAEKMMLEDAILTAIRSEKKRIKQKRVIIAMTGICLVLVGAIVGILLEGAVCIGA